MKLDRLRNFTAIAVFIAVVVVVFVFQPGKFASALIALSALCVILLVKYIVTRGIPLFKLGSEMWAAAKSQDAEITSPPQSAPPARVTRSASPPVRREKKRRKKAAKSSAKTPKVTPTRTQPATSTPPAVNPQPPAGQSVPPLIPAPPTDGVAELEKLLSAAHKSEAALRSQIESLTRDLEGRQATEANLLSRIDAMYAEMTSNVRAAEARAREQERRAERAERQLAVRAEQSDEEGRAQSALRSAVTELARTIDLMTRSLGIQCGKQPSFVDLPVDGLLELCRTRADALRTTIQELRSAREKERGQALEASRAAQMAHAMELQSAKSANERLAAELESLRTAHAARVTELADAASKLEGALAERSQQLADSSARLEVLTSTVATLEREAATPKVADHPLTAMQARLARSFGSPGGAQALLDDPATNPRLCFTALLLHPNAAGLIADLQRQTDELVATLPAPDPESGSTAHEEAVGPLIAVSRFIAEGLDGIVRGFVEPLASTSSPYPLDLFKPPTAALLLAAHLYDKQRFDSLRESGALVRLLSHLPVGVRAALARSAPSPEQAALLLFGGGVLRRACLKLKELAQLDPSTVARMYGATVAFPGHRSNDPRRLRLKRWLAEQVKVSDREIEGDLFHLARTEMNGVFALNEGEWRNLIIQMVGSVAQPHNHGLPLIEGVATLGFDPRDLLFFLDPSVDNCASCGLDSSQVSHFTVLADLVDPMRAQKGDLDSYLEFFEHLVRVRGIDSVRRSADHAKQHVERLKGTAARAVQSAA